MMWKHLWKQAVLMVSPQDTFHKSGMSLDERETNRHGRFLAKMILADGILLLLLAFQTLVHPRHPSLIPPALVIAVTVGAAALWNRRRHVMQACCILIAGNLVGSVTSLLAAPTGHITLSLMPFMTCCILGIQASYLLGRRAPYLCAAFGALTMGVHALTHRHDLLILTKTLGIHYLAVGLVPSIPFFLLAALSSAGANNAREAFANAARAEEMERLYQDAERQRLQTDELRRLAARLAAELDQDALLHQIATEITGLGYAGCTIFLVDTDTDGKQSFFGHLTTYDIVMDIRDLRFQHEHPHAAELLQGNPVRVDDVSGCRDYDDYLKQALVRLGADRMFLLPISYHGQTLGALVIVASQTAWGQGINEQRRNCPDGTQRNAGDGTCIDPFGNEAGVFLAALADHAALALGNANLMRKMRAEHNAATAKSQELMAVNQQLMAMQTELEAQYIALEQSKDQLASLATTDGMTGLANHRAFQVELARQVARSQRSGDPLSLLLLDVDFFKLYNDKFGHPAGDEVLKMVSNLLRSTVREGDFPARYGGEEFSVIFPGTDVKTAESIAERIRLRVEKANFPHRAITISLGVTGLLNGEAQDALVQRTDVALYEAKSTGRNCVVCIDAQASELAETLPPSLLLSGSAGEGEVRPQDIDALADEIRALEELEHVHFQEPAPGEITEAERVSSLMPAEFRPTPNDICYADGGLEGLLQEPTTHLLSELVSALDKHSAESAGHSERVTRYSLRVGLELAKFYSEQRRNRSLLPMLTTSDMIDLAYGALLHDIGQIGIPTAILHKTGKLTDDEWRQIRRHPLAGAELIVGQALLERALPVVRYHHERWDGTGYPQGLSGEAIPLNARIFSVCDALESLTTDKPYRARLDYAAARDEIVRGADKQFDGDVVAAFLRIPLEDWQSLSCSSIQHYLRYTLDTMRLAA